MVWATNTWAVELARRCRRRFDPRSRSFSLSSTSVFSSLPSTSVFISSRCSFSCHSPLCPAPVRPGCLFCLFLSLLSPSSQPPNRPCQSERSSKARHEADSFEPAEWSEQLTPGQSGWLGAAAVGSIPALALSLFLQRLYFLLFLQRLYLSLCAVRSAAILLFVLRRFVLAASSACFFPFFLPPPNPPPPPPIDRVSPNVALKLVTKPILLNRLSGLSD